MLASSPQVPMRYMSALRAFAQGCKQWIDTWTNAPLEGVRLGAGAEEHLTSDAGFQRRIRRGAKDVSLLARRMTALGLDPYELGLAESALVGHLQRRCMLCESWPRCLHDLTREDAGAAGQDCRKWVEYCPNVSTLEMLRALQDCTKVAPRYSFPYLG